METTKEKDARELKVYDYEFSTRIMERKNGSWSVFTPISGEHGFKCEQDARDYASTYGRIDHRQ